MPWCRRAGGSFETVGNRVADGPDSESQLDPAGRLVDRMLREGRQALLLRAELATSMTPEQRVRAQQRVCEAMAFVAAGGVCIVPWKPDDNPECVLAPVDLTGRPAVVHAFWLDRLQVSNQQFQWFVDAGGYQNESYWAATVRKRIGDFVDRSGLPGPRFWRDGRFLPGQEDHPVVGVCWFESDAFARWQGKRLPTDAQWMKAACCPLATDEGHSVQRLYPWGQDPRAGVANLWGSDLSGGDSAGTIATDRLPGSATEAGNQQMLGNVWEWTASEFKILNEAGEVALDRPLVSLRGGGFDTYFGDQATCQLQSGDYPLARKHNIGFRCAIDASAVELDEFSPDELSAGDAG